MSAEEDVVAVLAGNALPVMQALSADQHEFATTSGGTAGGESPSPPAGRGWHLIGMVPSFFWTPTWKTRTDGTQKQGAPQCQGSIVFLWARRRTP